MLASGNGVLPEFDNRRELWRLLGHLTPQKRIAWLQWCCRQISTPVAETKVLESDGTVGDVYWSAISIFDGTPLTVEKAGERLVEMVRRK